MDRLLTSDHSVFKFEYRIGEVVYYRTDPEQNPHLITGIVLRINGHTYEVSLGTEVSYAHAFELQREPLI